jgi:hypothetical protein
MMNGTERMTMTTMLINGIIQVTGSVDVGKTTFALECGASPDKMLFVDGDTKGRSTVQQLQSAGLKFGRYVDFVEDCKGKSLLDIHHAGMSIIESIEQDQYDAIVWDTWSRFASTFKSYVDANKTQFRAASEWSAMGKISGAERWKESQLYEAQVLNRLQSLTKCIVLVTHLKDHYVGGTKSGKRIPDSSRTLNRIPRMRLWLTHNPSGSPVPCALVLKRIDVKRMTDKGLRTVSVLPRKITPRPKDESLWDTIAWYFKKPIGLRQPTPDETPNSFELSILDGTLTKEQQETLRLSLKIAASEIEDDGQSEQIDQVKQLASDGMKPGKIAKETGLKIAEVRKMLKG